MTLTISFPCKAVPGAPSFIHQPAKSLTLRAFLLQRVSPASIHREHQKLQKRHRLATSVLMASLPNSQCKADDIHHWWFLFPQPSGTLSSPGAHICDILYIHAYIYIYRISSNLNLIDFKQRLFNSIQINEFSLLGLHPNILTYLALGEKKVLLFPRLHFRNLKRECFLNRSKLIYFSHGHQLPLCAHLIHKSASLERFLNSLPVLKLSFSAPFGQESGLLQFFQMFYCRLSRAQGTAD